MLDGGHVTGAEAEDTPEKTETSDAILAEVEARLERLKERGGLWNEDDVREFKNRLNTSPPSPNKRYIDTLSSKERKQYPMCTGLLDYFPDALAVVAHLSWLANEKHNPGEPLHHARSKSTDQEDCAVRHMVTRDSEDVYYVDGLVYRVPHWASAAWRLLAYGQQEMERKHNLPLPRGARE